MMVTLHRLDTESMSSLELPEKPVERKGWFAEFLAELLSTFLMVALAKAGAVSLAAVAAQEGQAGAASLQFAGLSAGLPVMVGILVAGRASGAHMNPAVSLAMVAWGRLPPAALPAYLAGQLVGAAAATALTLLVFSDTVGEAGVWPGVVASSPGLARSQLQLGLDQGLATFALVCVVCAVEDQNHGPPALLVGLTVATITLTMGANAGASMNPAVDLAAR